ncbi:MAG: type II secretion system protein GspN [Desulfomonilia bacterium]|jgi:type II secretion system protein N|uniref:Type II secretion system protein GspN n=1 Tax=anaerobic digester metagenome TaxID=1263854 RepID=A0A485M0B2_9ZZZZ|nr:type II secretion system protein GspN [Pseudomonadota bacterium]HON37791.1 type II secretion system protein GspN [Deltaproteobacteria bacterium]HRS55682.1 type II secretion system protein GspN [Desulfomonilia bacterium]HPD20843.1 type II secretion system protein GspN [Deltaproteobacteria bacterium]HPX18340.1 type II secretion system protein GspN [Deltaproteobacteria bacterium]
MADEKKFSPRMAKAGLGLYLFFCLVLFVLVRFPYDTFRGRLEETMSSLIGRPVALGHISSSLPFGLKVEGVSIGENPFAKELKIRPGLISLLTGSLDLDMEAFFPSGSLSGRVRTPLGTMGESLSVSARMDGLDSQAFQSLFPSGVQPRGIVSGTIDLSRPNASPREMEGRADIIWKDGYLPIPHSQLNLPLPLDGIQFTTLKVESVVEKGLVTLENIELAGDISGSIKGTIRIMEPFSRSRLNLTGEVGLPPDLAQLLGPQAGPSTNGMRFSLRGTLDRPRFRLLNR